MIKASGCEKGEIDRLVSRADENRGSDAMSGSDGRYGCGGGRRVMHKYLSDPSPWMENNVRAMEDALELLGN